MHAWPEDVQRAIETLQPGELSEPIELSPKILLFELVGTKVVPLDEVKSEIEAKLAKRRPSMAEIAGFVNELYQRHAVRTLRCPGSTSRSSAGSDLERCGAALFRSRPPEKMQRSASQITLARPAGPVVAQSLRIFLGL